MKTLLKATTAALAFTVMGVAAHAEGKLAIYHWFEYIPQELLDKFSAQYDVEVVMDTYDSNEALLANLKAGSMGTYDVAVPG
ncbi:MAG: ABC transporter substrate-binding protein, partial [Paracoccaceae bacterium]